jgi:hypothetical protein
MLLHRIYERGCAQVSWEMEMDWSLVSVSLESLPRLLRAFFFCCTFGAWTSLTGMRVRGRLACDVVATT